ncbi:MAG: pseudouridine synthase [Oscillospiraceae bacterium]|jgi:23S rRNA pseudouridine2605 synthase
MRERVQKIIARSGICSRRKAEELISEGRVSVNGLPCSLGMEADPDSDEIEVDGKPVPAASRDRIYMVLYKPRGFVTTMSDEKGRKCVGDLISGLGRRAFPVGRLDSDSEGLLLITDDGGFANSVMHPSSGIPKTYRVSLGSVFISSDLDGIMRGTELDGRTVVPRSARLLRSESGKSVLEVTVTEGLNREVRRIFESRGYTVTRLKRTGEGPVRLGHMKAGEMRPLTEAELEGFAALGCSISGRGGD